MSRRTEKIASELRSEVARLLREEGTDPRIGLVDDGLHSAAPFLRRRAARVLSLKRMPELRFRYDPSLSLGADTLSLLRSLGEAAAEAEAQGGDESESKDATRSQADDETA